MDPYETNRAPVPVSFGAKDWQELRPEVASMLLSLFYERQPEQFGAYLAEALTGVKPKASRGRLCIFQCSTTAGNGSAPTTTWTADTAPGAAPPSTASTASANTSNGTST